MPVRNIRGLGGKKPIPVFVWIPPQFTPVFKIELYDGTTTYDVTDIVLEGEYTWGVTETIGTFSFRIDNSTQTYLNTFVPYNEIRIYADYGTTATTLRFKGIIERVSKKDFTLVLSGRGPATKYMDKNVTYAATNKSRSTILSDIISKYFTNLTTTNLDSDIGTETVNYFDKPFWEVVEDICGMGTRDAYVDSDFDFNYFSSGSKKNNTEAIVHESNLIETGDFAPDASLVFNKIKVYGNEVDGIPLIATASDSTSQTTYGVKELKIDDSNITTPEQAQARANYELAIRKDAPTIGTVTSLGLPTLAPGEQLRISDPFNGLNPKYYNVFEYKHKFSNDAPFMTEVTIEKERVSLSKIMKKRIKSESETLANVNPNEMDYSYIWNFNTNIGTHSSTQISINDNTGEGYLETTGGATGTWESPVLELDSNVTAVELKMAGTNISSVQLFVSVDGGTVYHSVLTGDTTITTGNDIKIKVVFNSATTQINRLALLYKL